MTSQKNLFSPESRPARSLPIVLIDSCDPNRDDIGQVSSQLQFRPAGGSMGGVPTGARLFSSNFAQ